MACGTRWPPADSGLHGTSSSARVTGPGSLDLVKIRGDQSHGAPG